MNYINAICQCNTSDSIVFISNQSFTVEHLTMLYERGHLFYLAYPSRTLKSNYLDRYIKRGNNDAFLSRMDSQVDIHIDALETIDFALGHLVLSQEKDTLESILEGHPEFRLAPIM